MTIPVTIPDTQKVWLQTTKGTPQIGMQMKADWPVTKNIPPGKVLVKIQAAALNSVDHKTLATMPNFIAKRPRVNGCDFAGYIVDPGNSDFQVGEPVFGWVDMFYGIQTKEGALAEYIVIPASDIARRPVHISPIEASGIALVSMTALQVLEDGQLEAGQTLLIHGAGTSVGLAAIQMAKIKGAKVVAVASGQKEELVRRLGADEFIDYTKIGMPLHRYLVQNPPSTKYNLVLEAVGVLDPSLYTSSRPYLAPNGAYISVGPAPKFDMKSLGHLLRLLSIFIFPSFITRIKPRFSVVLTKSEEGSDGRKLQQISEWLAQGKLVPLIDSEYSFEDTLKGFERSLTGRATGKIIIKIDPSIESSKVSQ